MASLPGIYDQHDKFMTDSLHQLSVIIMSQWSVVPPGPRVQGSNRLSVEGAGPAGGLVSGELRNPEQSERLISRSLHSNILQSKLDEVF